MFTDRVPVRLLFNNAKLETLAETNLKSRVVMALQSLTVKEFIAEVLEAMQATRSLRKYRIDIVFYGKSVRFPIRF